MSDTSGMLSQSFGAGFDTQEFSWTHFIEPYSNLMFVQTVSLPPGRVDQVTIGGKDAKRLHAETGELHFEDWYLPDPQKGTREIRVKGEFSRCDAAASTFEDIVEVFRLEDNPEPLPKGVFRVSDDWRFTTYESRGIQPPHPILSTAFGRTRAENWTKCRWDHHIPDKTSMLVVELAIQKLPGRWRDPKTIVHATSVRVNGSDGQLLGRIPGEGYSTGDGELWVVTKPPLGLAHIEVVGLADANENPVPDRFVYARSTALRNTFNIIETAMGSGPDSFKNGVLRLGFDWLKQNNGVDAGGYLARAAIAPYASEARAARATITQSRIESQVVVVVTRAARQFRARLIQVVGITKIGRIFEALSAFWASQDEAPKRVVPTPTKKKEKERANWSDWLEHYRPYRRNDSPEQEPKDDEE